jgi:hypothetical protein
MSIAERIRAIIDAAKRQHERQLQTREQRVEAEAVSLSRGSREGSAWLSAHVMPVLLELRRGLAGQDVTVEMDENLAPEEHLPAAHFTGPSISMRLLQKSQSGRVPASSARYVFHCDGEFLNIRREAAESRPLGMPFDIDSNPHEAEEIVLEIVRRALSDYYQQLES